MKLLKFLSYNNAVPVTISLVLLGAGSAFAAGNPDAILSSQQNTLTVDNTYIAQIDLSVYIPQVEITTVTENEENYYVGYNLTTIDIQNYVWKDVTKSEVMQISKRELDGDLGLYVTKRLRDVVANTRTYLSQVQEKERSAVTQRVVSTTYSGLVGKFLDAKTETLPGYTPVIAPPPPEVAAVAASSGAVSSVTSIGVAQISLQVLGNNPAQVPLRASYVDLGAVLIDPYNLNVGVHVFLNGKETPSPTIDTSTSSVHVIEYRATDRSGNMALVRRIVLVGDALSPGGEISSSGTPVAPPAPQVSTPTPSIETPVPVVPPVEPNETPILPDTTSVAPVIPEVSTSTEAISNGVGSTTETTIP